MKIIFGLSIAAMGAAALAVAGSAQAQPQVGRASTPSAREINVGETLRGELTDADPKHDDGTPYDPYRFHGTAGQRVTIDMTSTAFDSYLVLRQLGETKDLDTDDDGGDGQNARLTYTLPSTGDFEIRANAVGAGNRGAYSLSLGTSAAAKVSTATPITLGQTLTGAISETDPLHTDETPYDPFIFKASAGQTVTVDMKSQAFDAYLVLFRDGRQLDSDDDSGGGNDARLTFTANTAGDYEIRANAVSRTARGAYSVTVSAGAKAAEAKAPAVDAEASPPRPITVGQTMRGELTHDDDFSDDDTHYDTYTFRGTARQKIEITLTSDDFDAFVAIRKAGDEDILAKNDDDDDNATLDSRLVFTLPSTGQYEILVSTADEDEVGDYVLKLK